MYKVEVEVRDSKIDGKGVFTKEDIARNTIVWIFDEYYDLKKTQEEFEKLSVSDQEQLKRVAYLSPTTLTWVYPPSGDPAEYTNHSALSNLTVITNGRVSIEPYFVANRDIKAGEELTNNYFEFDKLTQANKPVWMS